MSKEKNLTKPDAPSLTFDNLVHSIQSVNEELVAQAGRAVNISLTLRNLLIGYTIAEYELRGTDRAGYGERLLEELARKLSERKISNCNRRQLYDYLRFYRAYPHIVPTLSAQFTSLLPKGFTLQEQIVPTLSAQFGAPPERLIERLSYSMFRLLVDLDDDARAFYEAECIRGNWSVRELKRQISSLYFERSALSRNKVKLAEMAHAAAEQEHPRLDVRDPYVFEFIGLKSKEVMSESHLEDQLLDKLHDFLLELGHGFCFEARQKRILIGNTHGFVDLVFYHRLLKCHVLIELKLEDFSHQNIGQLNTYVSWYRKNVMVEGDNPPVGILLCAQKDHALAEYALAGMDNNLFVSKYQLHLPDREQLRRELERTLKEEAGE